MTSLPTIPVADLEIQRREDDLVIGTFGLGIYVLDDLAPLRTPSSTLAAGTMLFRPRDSSISFRTPGADGAERGLWNRAVRRG